MLAQCAGAGFLSGCLPMAWLIKISECPGIYRLVLSQEVAEPWSRTANYRPNPVLHETLIYDFAKRPEPAEGCHSPYSGECLERTKYCKQLQSSWSVLAIYNCAKKERPAMMPFLRK